MTVDALKKIGGVFTPPNETFRFNAAVVHQRDHDTKQDRDADKNKDYSKCTWVKGGREQPGYWSCPSDDKNKGPNDFKDRPHRKRRK